MPCRGRACPAQGHPKGRPYARRKVFAGNTRIYDLTLRESRSEGVDFLGNELTADLDFAFVLAGLCEIVGKLHA